MHKACDRGFVALVVSEEREERIDVFRLVVAPERCIIRFSSRTLHKTSSCAENAFGPADLAEAEHRVQHVIRAVYCKLPAYHIHEFLPFGFFLACIYRNFHLRLLQPLDAGADSNTFTWGDTVCPVLYVAGSLNQGIAPFSSGIRIGRSDIPDCRDKDGHCSVPCIGQCIFFADGCPCRRREIAFSHFDIGIAVSAFRTQQTIERNGSDLLSFKLLPIDGHTGQKIRIEPDGEACVRVVRDGAEHGPDH